MGFVERRALEYQVHRRVRADRRVDHQVETVAVGPFDAEVLLDESGAVEIDRFGKLVRVAFAFTGAAQALDLFTERGVNKRVEGIAPPLEVIGRSAPDDDGLAAFGNIFDHALRDFTDAIGIRHFQPRFV